MTKAPYFADPRGEKDSTKAIQDAVNSARDNRMICFFPPGTYLISDTISCEQRVQKLDQPRYTDSMRQSWWDTSHDRHYLLGSAKEKRPVLKLAENAKGFDDPKNPKFAMKIWAQTRNDMPGKHEPEWGSEQPNISFGHILRGIDFDIQGHSGAIGLRHTGSQGTRLIDSKVYAEGAFAGFNNCPGQGGGTYNIEVEGGKYGLVADPAYRFPMLAACSFKGQSEASIIYTSANLPMVLVGCELASNGPCAINLASKREFPGLSLIDCHITLKNKGSVIQSAVDQNIFLENTFVNGTQHLVNADKILKKPEKWTHFLRYSSTTKYTENLINGKLSESYFNDQKIINQAPSPKALWDLHWKRLPSFEDEDIVNIKNLGAIGDGKADDTKVFKMAFKKYKKIFLPNGSYKISDPLELGPDAQLFGIDMPTIIAPAISTFNSLNDQSQFAFIRVDGKLHWNSGKGDLAFCQAKMHFGDNGGGRLYATTQIGGRDSNRLLEGTKQPISIYTLNVERKSLNPQSYIKDAKHVKIFYLKAEASPVGYTVHGGPNTGNTPLSIQHSHDIRVYAVCGNILTVEKRPVIEVRDSENILISQIKSFRTGNFPQIREINKGTTFEIGSDKTVGLFVRE